MFEKLKFQLFLARNFPQNGGIFLSVLLLIYSRMHPILEYWQIHLIHFYLAINGISVLLIKHKIYKFKMRREQCKEFIADLALKADQNQSSGLLFNEIFDRHNRFKYTEVIVPRGSDIRKPIELLYKENDRSNEEIFTYK